MVAVYFRNGSKNRLLLDGLNLEVPEGWSTISDKTKQVIVKPGDNVHAVFRLKVPNDAAYTRPYWHRDNPFTDSINHIDNEKYATLPFPPPVCERGWSMRLRAENGGERRISATLWRDSWTSKGRNKRVRWPWFRHSPWHWNRVHR